MRMLFLKSGKDRSGLRFKYLMGLIMFLLLMVTYFNAQGQTPVVIWEHPATSKTESIDRQVIIKAIIESKFDLQNVEVLVNNVADHSAKPVQTLNADKVSYFFSQTISLRPGENTVVIMAANAKGLTYSEKRIIGLMLSFVPSVTFISPAAKDSLYVTSSVIVRAEIVSATQIRTCRLLLNGRALTSGSGEKPVQKDDTTFIFEKHVDLQNGLNAFILEAENRDGKTGSADRTLLYVREPSVKWILPASVNNFTDDGILKIRAEIISPFELQNALINLNGNNLPEAKGEFTKSNESTYIFKKDIKLNPGNNNIFISAGNSKGIGTSGTRFAGYLLPVIKVINPSPADSIVTSGSILLKAEVTSRTDLQTARIFLNGSLLTGEPSKKPERKDSITYLVERHIQLQTGSNTIFFEAKNNLGTTGSDKYNIIWQVEPFIAWISPAVDKTASASDMVEIKAGIKSKFDLQSVRIFINDTLLPDENGLIKRIDNDNYTYERIVRINPGENTIYLDAGNAKGIGYSSRMKVVGNRDMAVTKKTITDSVPHAVVTAREEKHDDKPDVPIESKVAARDTLSANVAVLTLPASSSDSPEIAWISPSKEKSDINLNRGTIKVNIKSGEKLQSLLVYVNGTATEEVKNISASDSPGEFRFEKSVDFQPGENNIYLVASNSNGTSKSEPRYLTNPPTNPPVVSWEVPSNPKAIVNSEIINVEACIKSATSLKIVQVFVNGVQQASEMMFQLPQQGECNYRFNKDVILKEGDNSVIIIASNFAGSTNSDRRVIRFEPAMIAEKRLALIIGNADYGNSNVLRNPVNDANLIEGTLKNLGFEVIKTTNATKNEMMESLRDFSKKLDKFNVALFYYAGHGIQVDGQNYLIPVDAQLKEKADCKWEAVPVNYIVEEFERVPDNINIVILDACRNNPFRSWVRGGEEGFRALNPVSGTIVSFATSEGSTAADGSGSNGTFTEELVKQIVVPQAISSVFINTRREVMKRTNNAQRPQEWNMLTGEFYFSK